MLFADHILVVFDVSNARFVGAAAAALAAPSIRTASRLRLSWRQPNGFCSRAMRGLVRSRDLSASRPRCVISRSSSKHNCTRSTAAGIRYRDESSCRCSNFALEDRAEFVSYLAAPGGELLVAEATDAGVVAVGGCYVRDDAGVGKEGGLAWGMVARDWHGRGIGAVLLRAERAVAVVPLAARRFAPRNHL